MKKNNYQYFILFIVLVLSCRTMSNKSSPYDRIVKRVMAGEQEHIDQELPMEIKSNIFEDYLWTTPPVYCQEIEFLTSGNKKEANILFENKEYSFELLDDETIVLNFPNGNRISQNQKISKNNIYYNINLLETKSTPVKKLVTKVRFVTEWVTVWKTRPVAKTRTVTEWVHNPDGTSSTRMRTEHYTEYESYTDRETRTVPESYTVWETTFESSIVIPEYIYYDFKLNDKKQLFIYKISDENNNITYYLQNPTYYSAIQSEEEFNGVYDVHLLFVDVNSNGIYFEDDDKVLFTAWNPYDKESKYREVPYYMDNSWYRLGYLKLKKFISFSHNDIFDKIIKKYANSDYVGIETTGLIKITNLPQNARVLINGSRYLHKPDGTLNYQIEYGVYKLKIENSSYSDFEAKFIINESTNQYNLEYQLPKKCGTFEFQNGFLRHWVIKVNDENSNERIFYDENSIKLEPGNYKIIISANALDIIKDILIEEDKQEYVSFVKEIERISNEIEDNTK